MTYSTLEEKEQQRRRTGAFSKLFRFLSKGWMKTHFFLLLLLLIQRKGEFLHCLDMRIMIMTTMILCHTPRTDGYPCLAFSQVWEEGRENLSMYWVGIMRTSLCRGAAAPEKIALIRVFALPAASSAATRTFDLLTDWLTLKLCDWEFSGRGSAKLPI